MTDAEAPTAVDAYGIAWQPLREYFFDLLAITLVWGALSLVAGLLRLGHHNVAAFLYHLLVLVPLNFGGLYALLRAARGHAPRVRDLFEAFRSSYGQAILTHVLFVVLVGAGLVFFIVPGIIIATRLSFVGFLVVDEHMDAGPALRESWHRTRGYAGTIFLVWLLGIPISVGGLLLLGVGIIPAGIWIHLAFATIFALVTAGEAGGAQSSPGMGALATEVAR